MSTVVMHNVVSVDGYIADANDDVGPLFDWYFNGDHPLIPGEMDEPSPGGMGVSKASYDYIRPTWDGIGSMVIGRHLFDMTNGWEGRPPAGEHVEDQPRDRRSWRVDVLRCGRTQSADVAQREILPVRHHRCDLLDVIPAAGNRPSSRDGQ
jgi:hypothetical protein